MPFNGLPFTVAIPDSQMDSESKQERSRTRWTPALDKIFADLVVEKIQQTIRPNSVFDKKAWTRIRDEFNARTDLNFNNKQLRKHLDVLRVRYDSVKSSLVRNNFTMEEACSVGFDLWDDLGAHTKQVTTTKIKDCPIYEQLCIIFCDSGSDGKYAQSSHFEELEVPANGDSGQENGTLILKNPHEHEAGKACSVQSIVRIINDRKRKHSSENGYSSEQLRKDEENRDTMAKAMMEMVSASKSVLGAKARRENRFTITNCVKSLDEMEGVDLPLYFSALNLFEDSNLRETFLSLNGNHMRLSWLRGKFYSLYL